MESGTSAYQALKLLLTQDLPVSRDVLHVLIGAVLAAIALAAGRGRALSAPIAMAAAAALALGTAMELLDRRDDLLSLGFWRWRESLADVLRTAAVPLLALAACLWRRRPKD
jgi:hypothetical protein